MPQQLGSRNFKNYVKGGKKKLVNENELLGTRKRICTEIWIKFCIFLLISAGYGVTDEHFDATKETAREEVWQKTNESIKKNLLSSMKL